MNKGKGRSRGKKAKDSVVVLPQPAEGEAETKEQQAAVAPTVLHDLEKMRVMLEAEKEKNALLQDSIKTLQKDKEFLQQQMARMTSSPSSCSSRSDPPGPSGMIGRMSGKVKTVKGSSEDGMAVDTSSIETDDGSSSLPDSIPTKKRDHDDRGRTRTKSVQGVIRRYKRALHEFNKGGSMKKAFAKVGVDRNTISRTAPIAELAMASPEAFRALPPWDSRTEKMSTFADRCRAAITTEIKEKIGLMKSSGELLPISY